MVAMGNVLYNKRMGVLRDGDVGDLWAPVATLTGVRVVEARAAAQAQIDGHRLDLGLHPDSDAAAKGRTIS